MIDALGVGVVVPVHDEQAGLGASLVALERAGALVSSVGLRVRIVVVLDACTDTSGAIAERWARRPATGTHEVAGRQVVAVDARNVGAARRAGVEAILDGWAGGAASLWLATTDADSVVPDNWLACQLAARAAGAALWTGRVEVLDWSDRRAGTEQAWRDAYDGEGAPVHGASLGVGADAYLAAGGFLPLETGEDRALCRAVRTLGYAAVDDDRARVITSARRVARAPLGFASALGRLEAP